MTSTMQAGRVECTPEQGQLWQAQYGDGYSAGRGDGKGCGSRDGALIDIPAELPGENGAEYVARHAELAWRIGYTRAWDYEHAR